MSSGYTVKSQPCYNEQRIRSIPLGKLGVDIQLYETIRKPRNFFTRGRYFQCPWSEMEGDQVGIRIYRFIVVRTKNTHCLCFAVHTYGGRATTKPGVNPNDHAALIPTGSSDEYLVPTEKPLTKKPIHIIHENDSVSMDPAARISFAKVYTIEYTTIVRNIGRAREKDIKRLDSYFSEVLNIPALAPESIMQELTESLSDQKEPDGAIFIENVVPYVEGLLRTYDRLLKRLRSGGAFDAMRKRRRTGADRISHDDLPTPLVSLENKPGMWFKRTGLMDDLNHAVKVANIAVEAIPQDDPDRAAYLNDIGVILGMRFEQTGSIDDLNHAVKVSDMAVEATPQDHPDRAARLSNLGNKLGRRFEQTGLIDDLNRAFKVASIAVEALPQDDPDRAAILNNIGIMLGLQFEQTGLIDDLNRAIEVADRAVKATPKDNPNRAARLSNLRVVLGMRFEQTGLKDDLDRTIDVTSQAVDATSQDHPDRASWLSNLGSWLSRRFDRTGLIHDLSRAIDVTSQAVNTTQDHPDRASWLSNLGSWLSKQFEWKEGILSLTKYNDRYPRIEDTAYPATAIQHFEESVDQTPLDHPERAGRLLSLGIGYHDRYERTGDTAYLITAIQHFEESVDQTPLDHPERAGRLLSLGIGYRDRYERTGDTTYLAIAIQRLRESIDHSPSLIRTRLTVAMVLFPLYADLSQWKEACDVAYTAMQLLPLLGPIFLYTADKQHLLAMVAGLATDSAAIALCAESDSLHAIQLLELGREVNSGSLSGTHIDITATSGRSSELGRANIDFQDHLDPPEFLDERNLLPSSKDKTHIHCEAWNGMEKVLPAIRNQSGFGDFWLAPKRDTIQHAAKCGPIVFINTSQYRCDAILVEQDDIRSLPLLGLRHKDIKERAQNRDFGSSETLEWMWNTIADPVLEALGLTQFPSNDRWPHIWWITTGSLTQFPLHAAGLHKKNSHETVIDRVMSSYSSSIKAILHGRSFRYSDITPSTLPQALLVAVPNALGSLPLQFATKEVATLHNLCKTMAIDPIEPGRQKSDIILHLSQCKIFHFAGYSFTDRIDPSKSCLLLEDGKRDPLTVATLFDMNIRDHSPFLAYLSACGTGQINDERFFDESIHLISAFQLAGFRHAIGTLWEVNDEVCIDVATIVYEGMRDGRLSDESVCLGLHNASRKLRDNWLFARGLGRQLKTQSGVRYARHDGQRDGQLDRDAIYGDDKEGLLNWVPYVHFGV